MTRLSCHVYPVKTQVSLIKVFAVRILETEGYHSRSLADGSDWTEAWIDLRGGRTTLWLADAFIGSGLTVSTILSFSIVCRDMDISLD